METAEQKVEKEKSMAQEIRDLGSIIKKRDKEVKRLETDLDNLREALESSKNKRDDLERRIRAVKAEAEEKLKDARKVATVLKEALKKLEASGVSIPIAAAKSLVKLDNDIERLATIETK